MRRQSLPLIERKERLAENASQLNHQQHPYAKPRRFCLPSPDQLIHAVCIHETSTHPCLSYSGSYMPESYTRLMHASIMPVTYWYSNHRLIHASSLGSAHSRLIVVKPHYIHESLAHSCLIVHGSLMPHDIQVLESQTHLLCRSRIRSNHRPFAPIACMSQHTQAHSGRITRATGTKGVEGGDPGPASLDWERMVDPLLLLLGGGTTGVCTVAD